MGRVLRLEPPVITHAPQAWWFLPPSERLGEGRVRWGLWEAPGEPLSAMRTRMQQALTFFPLTFSKGKAKGVDCRSNSATATE